MKMMISQRGSVAFVVYHLRPLTTYSSPSRTIELSMLVASLDATAGSVIANAERISPASSGVNHRVLLLGRAVPGEHFHVAGVGRRAVEHLRREVGTTHHLAQRCVLQVRQPGAVLAVGEEQVPQPGRPGRAA